MIKQLPLYKGEITRFIDYLTNNPKEFIKEVKKRQLDINLKTDDLGNNLLLIIVKNKKYKALKNLLKYYKDLDLTVVNNNGDNVFISIFKDKCVDFNVRSIYFREDKKDVKMLKMLLKKDKTTLFKREKEGFLAFEYAVAFRYYECVKILLKNGVKKHYSTSNIDFDGLTIKDYVDTIRREIIHKTNKPVYVIESPNKEQIIEIEKAEKRHYCTMFDLSTMGRPDFEVMLYFHDIIQLHQSYVQNDKLDKLLNKKL